MAGRSSVARGTVLGIVAQTWQMLTAFLLYHFLAARLGTTLFGQWRVILSVLLYFELLVTSGLVQVTAKRLAEAPEEAPRTERGGYLAQGIVAIVLFVLALVLAEPIARALGDPSLAPLLRIASLDIPLVAVFMIAGSTLLGRHRFERQVAGMAVYATAKFVAIGLLVWRGFSVPGALIGNAISSVVGFAVVFVPWERASIKVRETLAEARGLGVASLPFLAQTAIAGVSSDADLWFLQAIKGAAIVGPYSGAFTLADIPSFLFAALSRVLLPSVARADAENDEALVARYATQAVRIGLLVTVLAVGVIAATGAAALSFVYTSQFAAAAPVFTVLMLASVGRITGTTCSDVLMGRGRRGIVLLLVGGTAVFEIALLSVGVQRFGALGAAWSATIAALAWGLTSMLVLRRLIGKRVLFTLIRSVAAAAVVGWLLTLVHPLGWWLFAAYVAAVLAYGALLLAFGEVDKDDIDSIRAAMRR